MNKETKFLEIQAAVARGWCTPRNAHKILDVDLVVDIAQEVYRALTPTFSNKNPKPALPFADYTIPKGDT